MRNYSDQKHELEIAKERLNSLRAKRRMYFEMTQPKSGVFSGGETLKKGITKILSPIMWQILKELIRKLISFKKKLRSIISI